MRFPHTLHLETLAAALFPVTNPLDSQGEAELHHRHLLPLPVSPSLRCRQLRVRRIPIYLAPSSVSSIYCWTADFTEARSTAATSFSSLTIPFPGLYMPPDSFVIISTTRTTAPSPLSIVGTPFPPKPSSATVIPHRATVVVDPWSPCVAVHIRPRLRLLLLPCRISIVIFAVNPWS